MGDLHRQAHSSTFVSFLGLLRLCDALLCPSLPIPIVQLRQLANRNCAVLLFSVAPQEGAGVPESLLTLMGPRGDALAGVTGSALFALLRLALTVSACG